MALVVLPEGVQISGSIGGTTWSHNRFGAYKRNRSVPVNPNTDRQVAVRNAVRALTIAWQNTLSQAQRDAWETYAANIDWLNHLGRSVLLTGLNHYVRSNVPRLAVPYITRIDDGPTIFNIATAELSLGATGAAGTQAIVLQFDDTDPDGPEWLTDDGAYQWFAMGLPQNAAIKFFGGPWRHLHTIAGNSTTPPTTNVTTSAVFPIAEGQRIWVRSRIGRADGRLSEFAQVNFLCGASAAKAPVGKDRSRSGVGGGKVRPAAGDGAGVKHG